MSDLAQFAPIAALLILTTVMSLVIVLMSRVLGPFRPTTRKIEPYESGMTPIGPAMRRFPVKFYLVAVLFILFDIEVVFFLPFAVVARQLGVFALVEMGVFIGILLIGYVYAWRRGALEWE
ncbi:MAG TPA: NADH-quinone oxidoreductase subunit A [Aggregatilineaceae bacterium]|nr:NADH-quinone oxidoreductase subunit A [Aggregatilineaceae bacterium]